jgi:hypothetical protein
VYDVAFTHYSTAVMFGRAPKLALWFKVVTFGEYFDTPLPRYYNAAKIIGKPMMYGRFKVGFQSDFLREFVTLFGMPKRLDRIPMTGWEKHTFVAKVRTVEVGSKQRAIPDGLRYSVISEIMRIRD